MKRGREDAKTLLSASLLVYKAIARADAYKVDVV